MKRRKLIAGIAALIVAAVSIAVMPASAEAAGKPAKPKNLGYSIIRDDTGEFIGFYWDDVSNVKGYEYRYATDWTKGAKYDGKGKVKKSEVKVAPAGYGTVRFQVRSFRKEKGKKVYSGWKTTTVEWNGFIDIVGGETINDEIVETGLSEEELSRFNEAMEGFTGVEYKPVAVIGQQVVAGMNYMYLCSSKGIYPGAVSGWSVVNVYQPLSGKAVLKENGIVNIESSNFQVAESTEQLSGGWSAKHMDKGLKLPEDAQAAFDKASGKLVGVEYKPIALFSRQVVAGIYYCIFCQGTTVTAEPVDGIYMAVVYDNPSGETEISVFQMDLAAYSGN